MLTITPINFSGIRNLPKTNFITKPNFKKDTFEKNSINFKGVQDNEFITWAKNTNFNGENIKEIINNKDNIIGTGFLHSAFSIPGNDNYVLRVGNSTLRYSNNANWKTAKFTDVEDKNLDINIGQTVAYIEINAGNFTPVVMEVLKKQEGESLGVKPSATLLENEFGKLREDEVPFEDITRKEKYARTIHELASMPIESYEKLIDDLNSAYSAGYTFDYLNSNNFLIDSRTNSINLIDMEKGTQEVPWDGILHALTNIYYYDTFRSEYDENPVSEERKTQAKEDTIEIINKFITAMKNKGEKFNKYNLTYEFQTRMANSIPFLTTFWVFSPEAAFKKLEQMGVA